MNFFFTYGIFACFDTIKDYQIYEVIQQNSIRRECLKM